MKKTKKASESPSRTRPPTSFSSLPYDVTLNILARISIIHRPTLSRVSKSFRSLMASRELHVTRALIRKTEDCLYVCLDLNKKKRKIRWFELAPIPKHQKLLPIPDRFPCQHPESSTVVSIGSDIYIIGGFLRRGKRSRRVLVLDSLSRQWRSLPQMRVPRVRPAAEVIDGKIYVTGGCGDEHWGEVYDPKTQTWELLSPTTLAHLTTEKSVVPGRLAMGGKVYDMNGLKLDHQKHLCLVEIEKNLFCQITIFYKCLYWRDANQDLGWSMVTGREGLSSFVREHLTWEAKLCGGRRLTVWWKEVEESYRKGCHNNKECKTEIWCAEISLQRCGFQKLRGVVEWSKNVFTLNGCGTGFHFSLDSAIVTH